MALRYLSGLVLALTGLSASASAHDTGFAPDRKVVYKSIDGIDLELHAFYPTSHDASRRSPAVVFFFGGGWSGGTPRQFYEQARLLADRGVVAFSADYRVREKHGTTPFECVQDGKSAIRWVRTHARTLGVDSDRIVAAGGSAGGHVAACTGVIDGLNEPCEDLSISSVPNAMILLNPVLDTTDKGFGRERVGKGRQTAISPCHHTKTNLPPTLVLHGTADTTVPFENAQRFTGLMEEAGNTCRLVASEGDGHGFFNGRDFRPKSKSTKGFDLAMSESLAFLVALGYIDDDSTLDR